ncbi:MAG: VOC family protein [Glaciimonas sp.]|nr:VOC family protein [Glaciimonas sp.]
MNNANEFDIGMTKNRFCTYLSFNGNVREAITFYHQCLGGELNLLEYAPTPTNVPDAMKHHLSQGTLEAKNLYLFAQDIPPDLPAVTFGDAVSLWLHVSSSTELESIFVALSLDGKVIKPIHRVFWRAEVGILKDKFGIQWYVVCPDPPIVSEYTHP